MTINRINLIRLLVLLAYTYFALQFAYAMFLARGLAGMSGSPFLVMIGYGLWVFMGGISETPAEDNELETV